MHNKMGQVCGSATTTLHSCNSASDLLDELRPVGDDCVDKILDRGFVVLVCSPGNSRTVSPFSTDQTRAIVLHTNFDVTLTVDKLNRVSNYSSTVITQDWTLSHMGNWN